MSAIFESMVREALAYEAEAFDGDSEINGADLLQWFLGWRERAKTVIRSEGE